jgi:hypothetical protein
MSAQPSIEQLRLAILVAAQEGDLRPMHNLTVAYHKAIAREENEPAAAPPAAVHGPLAGTTAPAVCSRAVNAPAVHRPT